MRETEARRLKDGGGCDGGSGQTKAPDGSQRIRAVRGTGAGRPPGHWVAAAWSDGVGGAVASLRDSMELPQTAEESKSREQKKREKEGEERMKGTAGMRFSGSFSPSFLNSISYVRNLRFELDVANALN